MAISKIASIICNDCLPEETLIHNCRNLEGKYYTKIFKTQMVVHTINENTGVVYADPELLTPDDLSKVFVKCIPQWDFLGSVDSDKKYDSRLIFSIYNGLIGSEELPEYTNNCVCTHHIEQNCYIKNRITKEILVTGNECIKHWWNKQKICPDCMARFNSKEYDKCKDCRFKRFCDKCGVEFNNKNNNFCADCNAKHKNGNCLLMFGNYRNETFNYVFENDLSYCNWVISRIPNKSNKNFIKFRDWCIFKLQ
jgi:hypothetical protein